ncbi:prephenate dehydratase domain-containing protein [Psychromonas sp. 14N.309.X.WAT.B.A12]|uniref:prephenate dehydratase n=1 Tax=unclassified Psychromonas TaxID=2614957 RepID=UPI0025AEDDCC|nr:prephenate dehydratase domain-containing protein [Psychromonas sp. 14N.309.X.WAT.B.A12]MDN2662619.1 ACT domain-containing protein [Psychromonas sp. 14N.309.X.WAT.B.A12]
MLTIATLGPKDTFSDLATKRYIQAIQAKQSVQATDIKYYGTLTQTFQAVGKECQLGVLPIENLSEGYVQVVLDQLLDTKLSVISELLLPIQFSFVGFCKDMSELTDLYVQFVAHGQCAEFINGLEGVKIHNTQSNIESLVLAKKHGNKAGAIIPQHALSHAEDANIINNDVTNYANNQTRFLVLSETPQARIADKQYKTTLVVNNKQDCPGVLGNIVSAFALQKVNLTSIMSRPTRSQIGNYHFFIDIDGHQEDKHIAAALAEIQSSYDVTVIGSYIKALN